MQAHWIWLAQLPELTLRQKRILLEAFPNPEDLYDLTQTDMLTMLPEERRWTLMNKDVKEVSKILRLCATKGIDILTISDEAYPEKLRQIDDAPIVLYYKGILPDFDEIATIGVVGTRKASAYGKNSATLLSSQIADCGGIVVSGGASGIDTAALQGAVDTGAQTVAVLGCGVDIAYPPTNRKLFSQIVQNGCLISEYPPGTEPKPWHFPARNRIISGISSGVLVVEAPEKSGALITARFALEQSRDVFVVPGNINTPSCAGSNALLQEGAVPVFSGWDVLRNYECIYPGKLDRSKAAALYREEKTVVKVAQKPTVPAEIAKETESPRKNPVDNGAISSYSELENNRPTLSGDEQTVLALLTREPQESAALIAQLGMPSGKVLSLLTMLTVKGLVLKHPGGRVSLK